MTDYVSRKKELLSFLVDGAGVDPMLMQAASTERKGVYLALATLELEQLGQSSLSLPAATIDRALALLSSRLDCCDFAHAALLRLLDRYPDSKLLTDNTRERITDASINHIYWVDEPGQEHMCFCTENHQIIHHSNELLAGQRWPEQQFEDGHAGTWHREHAEKLIALWLDWRLRFGFSEWNSNCYYDEDLIALLNMADYAQDDEIKRRAACVIDLILLHIAANSYQGAFGSTHGRTYTRMTLNPLNENTRPVAWLCFGQGGYDTVMSMGATMMAASDYVPPEVLTSIASDTEVLENRERHSLNVDEAASHGVDPHDRDNIGFFWGAQVFHHREVIDASRWLCTEKHYKWKRIEKAYAFYQEQDRLRMPYEPDPDHQAMTQVNVYSYRTQDYMLSCAQDYRKGRPGFQQHIWQATLPNNVVIYSNHPGALDVGKSRPDYWHGNGIMPRAMACKNVLVCLYHLDQAQMPCFSDDTSFGMKDPLPFTHAYMPQHLMDEVVEIDGWVIGRVGSSYAALRALNTMHWQAPRKDVSELLPGAPADPPPYEIAAEGLRTGWILELGSESQHGSFEQFCSSIAATSLSGDTEGLIYTSPSVGELRFGWNAPALVNGEPVNLGPYPRMANRFCDCPFDTPCERDYAVTAGNLRATIHYNR